MAVVKCGATTNQGGALGFNDRTDGPALATPCAGPLRGVGVWGHGTCSGPSRPREAAGDAAAPAGAAERGLRRSDSAPGQTSRLCAASSSLPPRTPPSAAGPVRRQDGCHVQHRDGENGPREEGTELRYLVRPPCAPRAGAPAASRAPQSACALTTPAMCAAASSTWGLSATSR